MTQHPLVAAAARVGVSDPRVLEAIRSVPRAAFVPATLAAQAELDRPLPIPHAQVTTQPSLVAQLAAGGRLVQPIGPAGDEDVILFQEQAGELRPIRTVTGARFVPLVGRHGFET